MILIIYEYYRTILEEVKSQVMRALSYMVHCDFNPFQLSLSDIFIIINDLKKKKRKYISYIQENTIPENNTLYIGKGNFKTAKMYIIKQSLITTKLSKLHVPHIKLPLKIQPLRTCHSTTAVTKQHHIQGK